MRYFLVEFDGHTFPAKVTPFADAESALAELAIREPLEPPDGETVLLGAESEEVLHLTHSRYFEDPIETYRRFFDRMTPEDRGRLASADVAP